MATKPTNLAEWASGNLAQTPDITEPTALKKAKGWIVEAPAHDYFNWWMNIVYTWILYLDDLGSQALTWTGDQIFQGNNDYSGISTFDGAVIFSFDPTYPARTVADVTPGTNWAFISAGDHARYYKTPDGEVQLAGALKPTSIAPAAVAFTLPSGFRPTSGFSPSFLVYGSNAAGNVFFTVIATIVASTGAVLLGRQDGGAWVVGDQINLTQIRFSTAA